ncbi:MAG: hypothetical protein KDB07_10510 [Planctomycetes bacterium]|nr:hypothetical protein [Planctomycetota bacterium]
MKKILALFGLGIAFCGVYFAGLMLGAPASLDAQGNRKSAASARDTFEFALLLHSGPTSRDQSRRDLVLKHYDADERQAASAQLFEYKSSGDGFFSRESALLSELNRLGKEGWQIEVKDYPESGDCLLKRKVTQD